MLLRLVFHWNKHPRSGTCVTALNKSGGEMEPISPPRQILQRKTSCTHFYITLFVTFFLTILEYFLEWTCKISVTSELVRWVFNSLEGKSCLTLAVPYRPFLHLIYGVTLAINSSWNPGIYSNYNSILSRLVWIVFTFGESTCCSVASMEEV